MTGTLIQWPTIITALMFPCSFFVFYRLSKREEDELTWSFGDKFRRSREKPPMFDPVARGKEVKQSY